MVVESEVLEQHGGYTPFFSSVGQHKGQILHKIGVRGENEALDLAFWDTLLNQHEL